MENIELTQEQLDRLVSATLDSVTVVNDVDSTPEEVSRNKEHLMIMMSKDWFTALLTKAQKTSINNAINK